MSIILVSLELIPTNNNRLDKTEFWYTEIFSKIIGLSANRVLNSPLTKLNWDFNDENEYSLTFFNLQRIWHVCSKETTNLQRHYYITRFNDRPNFSTLNKNSTIEYLIWARHWCITSEKKTFKATLGSS